MQALQAVEKFAQAWDLTLDGSKSVAWATSTQTRRQLRQQGLPVVLSARDLGGHVSLSRKRSNCSVAERAGKLVPVWPRLQGSLLLIGSRLRGLAKGPVRGLGGVLRSNALKGLNARKSGANPLVHLSLVEYPLADPGFYPLRSSVPDVVRYGEPATVALLASELLAVTDVSPSRRFQSCCRVATRPVCPGSQFCHQRDSLMHRVWCTALQEARDAAMGISSPAGAPASMPGRARLGSGPREPYSAQHGTA